MRRCVVLCCRVGLSPFHILIRYRLPSQNRYARQQRHVTYTECFRWFSIMRYIIISSHLFQRSHSQVENHSLFSGRRSAKVRDVILAEISRICSHRYTGLSVRDAMPLFQITLLVHTATLYRPFDAIEDVMLVITRLMLRPLSRDDKRRGV